MNSDILIKALRCTQAIADLYAPLLSDAFIRYGLNTVAERACFIGQVAVESANLRHLDESNHYSAKGLEHTFATRFRAPDSKLGEDTTSPIFKDGMHNSAYYAEHRNEIFDVVYAGVNGNTKPGDGSLYHGRGLIQITGRTMYEKIGELIKDDLLAHPEKVCEPSTAVETACAYWISNKLNSPADRGDVEGITRIVNGPRKLALKERQAITDKVYDLLVGGDGTGHMPSNPLISTKALAQVLSDLVPLASAEASPALFDPLVVDLRHDGRLTTCMEQGAYFDMANDGFAEKTAWLRQGNAFVVRDIDNDGYITSGKELFGDQTSLASGTTATNGFAALADLDSNKDGKFDQQDSAWNSVKLWIDDGDAISHEDELVSLEAAGIQSISLSYTNLGLADADNTIAQQNTTGVLMADGRAKAIASLLLKSNPMDTESRDYLDVPEDIAVLPDLEGLGKSLPLSQSMVRDPVLRMMVQGFVALSADVDLSNLFETILFQWAGVSLADYQSRGAFIDARHLEVVELFYGKGYQGVGGPNPNQNAAVTLEAAYQSIKDTFFAQLLAQAQLKPYWDATEIGINDSGTITYDFGAAAVLFKNATDWLSVTNEAWLFGLSAHYLHLDGTLELDLLKSALLLDGTGLRSAFESGLAGNPLQLGTPSDDLIAPPYPTPVNAYGFAGNDTLTGTIADDHLYGGDGNDVLNGGEGNDLLVGGNGDDQLRGGKGSDYLIGEAGNDILGGTDSLDQGAYEDSPVYYLSIAQRTFVGNTYWGGTGDDTLNGTFGGDTYLFNLGDGRDTIIEPGLTVQ